MHTMTVYLADTKALDDPVLFNNIYAIVSDRRKEKTDRLINRKDKMLSLGVEYLLFCACEDNGIDCCRTEIKTDRYGKPYLENNNFFFNLSHSEYRAMCVVSDTPAGCDVEKIKDADMAVAENFFREDEYLYVKSAQTQLEKNDRFFRVWTLKESFMKCNGCTPEYQLGSFSVLNPPKEYETGEYTDSNGYRYAWCVKTDISKGSRRNNVKIISEEITFPRMKQRHQPCSL